METVKDGRIVTRQQARPRGIETETSECRIDLFPGVKDEMEKKHRMAEYNERKRQEYEKKREEQMRREYRTQHHKQLQG